MNIVEILNFRDTYSHKTGYYANTCVYPFFIHPVLDFLVDRIAFSRKNDVLLPSFENQYSNLVLICAG